MSAEAPLPKDVTHTPITRKQFFGMARKTVEAVAGAAILYALPTPVLAQGPPPVPGNCYDPKTGAEMAPGGSSTDPNKGIETRCEPGDEPGKPGKFVTRRLSNSDAAPPTRTPIQTIGSMGRNQGSNEQPDYPSAQENGSGDSVFICGIAAILAAAAIGGLLAGASGGLRGASGRRKR